MEAQISHNAAGALLFRSERDDFTVAICVRGWGRSRLTQFSHFLIFCEFVLILESVKGLDSFLSVMALNR